MGRSRRSVLSSRAVDVRDEAAEVLDRLMAAGLRGATDVGERSRRAALAALAIRGQRRPSSWRWLIAGLAIGLVVGTVAGTALARRKCTSEDQPEPVDES